MGIKRNQRLHVIKDELEDFIIENSLSIRKKILKADEDLKTGRVFSFKEYLSTQEKYMCGLSLFR
jgi:hypothetical protein